MTNVIRVALPGYNAETDTNPDHFALYTDNEYSPYQTSNWVLIKEFSRGTTVVADPDVATSKTHHNLGYHPLLFDYIYETANKGDTNLVINKWKSTSISYGLPGRSQGAYNPNDYNSYLITHFYVWFRMVATHKWYIFYDAEGVI